MPSYIVAVLALVTRAVAAPPTAPAAPAAPAVGGSVLGTPSTPSAVGLGQASTSGGASGPAAVRSSQFALPLERLTWAGTANGVTCDTKCREGCLGAETIGSAGESWGDVAAQRAAGCLVGCGCGAGFDRVFATTARPGLAGGSVYASKDAGDTWQEVTKAIPAKLLGGVAYRAVSVHVSGADPRYVALLTNVSTSLISRDGGSTWQKLKVADGPVSTWQWHRTNKDWALATVATTSKAAGKTPKKGAEPRAIRAYYTQDAGTKWTLLLDRLVSCHWAHVPHADPGRVVAVLPASIGGKESSSLKQLVASKDFMKTKDVLIGKDALGGAPVGVSLLRFHFGFTLAVTPAFAADNSATVAGALQLWVRNDELEFHQKHAFVPVTWPGNVGPPSSSQLRGLQALHSTEDALYFFLPSADSTLPWGHVFRFTSASHAAELILSDVYRPSDEGAPEWHPVAGIEGAFVANRAIVDSGQDLDSIERQFDEQATRYAAERDALADTDDNGDENAAVSGSVGRLRLVIRTYISVDAGAAWQALQQVDGAGDRIQLASWVSSVAAPGILIGVGSTGLRLADDADRRDVFLSRDAGLSWKMVLRGNHQVAIMSYGDAVVALPAQAQGALKYSTDSGKTWQDVSLRSSLPAGAAVDGFFAHPSRTSWRLHLAARAEASREVTLLSVDLGGVLATTCKKSDSPSDLASDFERWSPADSLEDAHVSKRPVCFSGVKTRYLRRRADRQCKTVGIHLEPVNLRNDAPCPCTMADWACDAGFYRASYTLDAPCEPMPGFSRPNVSALCAATVEEYVNISRGYVKVPGNRCQGGTDLAPTRELCLDNTGLTAMLRGALRRSVGSSWRTTCFFLVLLVLAVGLRTQESRGKSDSAGTCGPPGLSFPLPSILGFGARAARKRTDELNEDDEEREFLISSGNNL
eukprot:TRINITY_DN23530_c0_g1_i1.p1 TRINITY_DN23530_c0_g1~~TRINITY_DN23530_c0_g1_i1.p1  ORF type:complete len:935 (+),score=174.78 TRINITY_DN23530_c0_g1_i1:31-2805(+)